MVVLIVHIGKVSFDEKLEEGEGLSWGRGFQAEGRADAKVPEEKQG